METRCKYIYIKKMSSNKRAREEAVHQPHLEDEIVKRITREVMLSLQQQPAQQSINPTETKNMEKLVPVEVLIETFDGILKNVLREDGLRLVSNSDSLLQFRGLIPYPFEMNMDLHCEIQAAVKRLSGSCWEVYDTDDNGMLVDIFFTQDRAMMVAKIEKDQKADFERVHKLHNQQPPTDEAGMMSFSLVCHLAVDLKTRAKFSQRPVGGDMTVISATVLLAEPIQGHQLDKLAVGQLSKMKALNWGKHQTMNKLRLTLDVTSPSMVDLSTHESVNRGSE